MAIKEKDISWTTVKYSEKLKADEIDQLRDPDLFSYLFIGVGTRGQKRHFFFGNGPTHEEQMRAIEAIEGKFDHWNPGQIFFGPIEQKIDKIILKNQPGFNHKESKDIIGELLGRIDSSLLTRKPVTGVSIVWEGETVYRFFPDTHLLLSELHSRRIQRARPINLGKQHH